MAAKAQVERDGDPDKAIAQVGPQQRGDDDGNRNQQAAHGGRACFFLMSLGAFFADVLADLKFAQAVDDHRTNDQSGEQGGQAGEGSAKRQIAENAEWREVMEKA